MKMKKVVALLSTMAMCGSFITAVPASADTVVSSWDFDAMDVGKFSTEVTDTDMYAVPRGGSISVMDMDAENSTVPKTVGDGSLANPSGKVLRIDSSATSGNEATGNAYVELPASLFFDGTTTDDTTTYALKETVAISYDLYSGTQGWRYGFFAGNSAGAGICYIPNGADGLMRALSNGNAIDGIPVPLNEWHHIDVVKTLSPDGTAKVMKTYLDGVLVTGAECFDFSNSDVFARIGYSPYGDVGADFYIDNITVSNEIPYSEDYAVSEIFTHTGMYENAYENVYLTDNVNEYEINDGAMYHRIYVKPKNLSNLKRIAFSLGTRWGDPVHLYAYATSAEIASVEELEAADLTTAAYTNIGSTSFTKRFVWGYFYPEVSVSNVPEDADGLIIEYYVSNGSGVYESGCYARTLALYSSEATIEPEETAAPEPTETPEPTEEPETIYNAYVGETGYETLDAALAAENEVRDESYTIVLKADQELTSVGNYSGAHLTTTITSDETRRKITLNPSTDGATFTYDIVVFDNVEMVSSTTCENDLWCVAAYQRSGNRYFTVNNSYLHDIVVTDCLSVFTQNNVTNSTVENNTAPAAIFANRIDSLIENSTITNNTATNLGAVEVVGGTTTIRNSTITGTISNRGDVSASGGTLRLEGETVIGTIYKGTATIVLGSDFTGSAAVKNVTIADGTVVATVEDGADVSGITVEGMDESAYELVVRDGQLVIVSKNTVNLVTETTYVNSRDYSADTGVETNKATGFATKITNTGTANGLFKTISWTVTSNGESKTSDKFDMGTEITLAPEAYVHVGFVVGNLCDASATAEATVFAE